MFRKKKYRYPVLDGNMSLSDVEKYLSKTNVQEINARYKYREVICEICEHRFMWETNFVDGIYYLKSDNERGKQAICPKCGAYLAVFNSEPVGLSECRDEIEKISEKIV